MGAAEAHSSSPGPGSGGQGTDLMHPLAVSAVPHVLARLDGRTAAGADLACGVQLVAVPLVLRVVVVGRRVLRMRAPEVCQQVLFGFLASVVGRDCHVGLLWARSGSSPPVWHRAGRNASSTCLRGPADQAGPYLARY